MIAGNANPVKFIFSRVGIDAARCYLPAALLILYPMLFIWQGLDFTDMGHALSGYQLLWTAPEYVGTRLVNWLTYVFGSLVEFALGSSLGVIAFKLAYMVVNWICAYIAYRVIKHAFPDVPRSLLVLSVFVSFVFITKSIGNWIGYNNWTALLYLLGATFLYSGLKDSSRKLIFAAGLIIGINVFVRLPNVLGLGLVVIILAYGLSEKRRLSPLVMSPLVKDMGVFTGGFFSALAGIFLIMYLTGHSGYYIDGLKSILTLVSGSESAHSGDRLANSFIRDHFKALLSGSLFLLAMLVFSLGAKQLSRRIQWIIIVMLSVFITFIFQVAESWKWIVAGVSYLLLGLGALLYFRRQHLKFLLVLLAGSVMLLVPLGSSNGIRNAVYGMWLALPVSIVMIHDVEKQKLSDFGIHFLESVDLALLSVISRLLVFSILLSSLFIAYGYTYRDSGNRLSMRYSIEHPRLPAVFTTRQRADVVGELLKALESRVKEGDTVLAYNEISMIHYLTHTRPWLRNSWPLLLKPHIILQRMKELEDRGDFPQTIIRATGNTSSREWPTGNPAFSANLMEESNRQIIESFIRRHDYRVTWSNEFFEILKFNSKDK